MADATRPCGYCGTLFTVGLRERNPRKWCSRACADKAHRKQGGEKLRARRRAASCKIYVEPCDECGELKTWRSQRRTSRTCSRTCENVRKARKAREQYASDPEAGRRRVYATRAASASRCVDCGEETSTPTALRCGRCQRVRAGDVSVESRKRAGQRQLWHEWESSRASLPNLLTMGRKGRIETSARNRREPPCDRTFYAGLCEKCGADFVTQYAGTKYCSSRCGDQWYWISRRRRFALYDRDEWTCQICYGPVPLVTVAPHPLSPSLDHIVPQSMRPGDHRDENLRLCHLLCNSIRSDESNPNWRDLIPAS